MILERGERRMWGLVFLPNSWAISSRQGPWGTPLGLVGKFWGSLGLLAFLPRGRKGMPAGG